MTRQRRGWSVAVVAACLLDAGCASTDEKKPVGRVTGPPPVCSYDTRSIGAGTASRSLATSTWFSFLLPGYRFQTAEVLRPVRDCAGGRVEWAYLGSSCRTLEADDRPLPPEPLTEGDIVVTQLSDTQRLVWVMAERFDNGEALGPVALAEFTATSLHVRALGSLRAFPDRARLRLERTPGGSFLVAEGEHCAPADGQATCTRAVRVMTFIGQRFGAEPVRRADGECVEPALFPLSREATLTNRQGDRRRFVLASTVSFDKSEVTIHEELSIFAVDPGQPRKLLRQAQADRVITLQDYRLVTSERSLWSRMAAEFR